MKRIAATSLLLLALTGIGASVASAYVIGRTPSAAALAAAKKAATHEVVAWNQPQVSYTLGSCHLLHRKPWLAYVCSWDLHGVPNYCHGQLTVAVRRLPDGMYRATGIKLRYTDTHGC